MSKIAGVSKNLFYLSKSSLKYKIYSLNNVNASYCKVFTAIPWRAHMPLNSSFMSDNISSLRLFTSGQQLMCSTKKNHSTVEEPIPESSTEKDAPETSNIERELQEKIEILAQEVENFKDKYQRTLADRENLRQRLEKQISDSKLFGIQSFCKDLLEVSDVFRKAIESVPEESVKEADSVFVSLYDGVIMTENQLLSVFRRHGLQKITPAEGEKFDPSVQEAMFEVPGSEGKLPGTVAHVIRTGWKLHDRCVRSAQVGVVKE